MILNSHPDTLRPPVAKRVPRDAPLHGASRVDDYFWMREKENPEVIAHLQAENDYTDAVMRPTLGLQETLYKEILGRIKETDMNVPYRQGGFFHYSRTEEGKQYPIHCRKRGSLDALEEVVLDLNLLAEGKPFLSLGSYEPSEDGDFLAFSLDETGFRDYTLYVKDIRSGALGPEKIANVSTVAWAADSRTLFYVTEDSAKRPFRLHRRVREAAASEGGDFVVFEEPDERFRVWVHRSLSGRFVFLDSSSLTTSELRLIETADPLAEPRMVLSREQDHEYDVDHRGDLLYIRTNSAGRNFQVVTAPVDSPGREHWTEFIPHRENVMIDGLELFARHAIIHERENALPRLRVIDLITGESHRVDFPEPVYDWSPGPNEEFDAAQYRLTYQSMITPQSVVDYGLGDRSWEVLKEEPVLGGYDRSRYRTERVHARAPDGTAVPISLVYRDGSPEPGGAPLVLYGYGAYGIPMDPNFSSARLSLLDRGVVYAIAHVRGGGEGGKKWHDAGRMLNKRNSFTDFIAVAEHLIAEKMTAPDRLVIVGGSAGGLLMGVVAHMRPELFRAVVSLVPFVDVINSMSDSSLPLTVAEFEEWGDPTVREQYDYIRTYSPYDNLSAQAYPPMLLRTSLNDSQVMYWEPAKYVAKMRALKTDSNVVLLKTNMAGGHGGHSGRYDRFKEIAFDYAYILSQLGLGE